MPLSVHHSNVRLLSPENWQLWKAIRLEALIESPEAFRVSYEEQKDKSEAEWQRMLTQNDILGYFLEDKLVGFVGFYTHPFASTAHKGSFFGTYVTPSHRRKGIADSLLLALIDHAKARVLQLHCSVITCNEPAFQLYKKYGFEVYGEEKRASKLGDTFYDEYWLVLYFS